MLNLNISCLVNIEHPKQIFKLKDKRIFTILPLKLFIWILDIHVSSGGEIAKVDPCPGTSKLS